MGGRLIAGGGALVGRQAGEFVAERWGRQLQEAFETGKGLSGPLGTGAWLAPLYPFAALADALTGSALRAGLLSLR